MSPFLLIRRILHSVAYSQSVRQSCCTYLGIYAETISRLERHPMQNMTTTQPGPNQHYIAPGGGTGAGGSCSI